MENYQQLTLALAGHKDVNKLCKGYSRHVNVQLAHGTVNQILLDEVNEVTRL